MPGQVIAQGALKNLFSEKGFYSENRRVILVSLIVIFAMALRLPLLYYFDVVPPDGVVLLEMSETFRDGSYFTKNTPEHHHEPLYPALIGLFSTVTSLDHVRSGQFLSFAAALITIVLAYKISSKIHGFKAGIYCALVLSMVPLHAFYSVTVLKESIYTMILSLAIYFCLNALEYRNKKYIILFGLSLGLAYSARLDGLLLLFLIPVFYHFVSKEDLPARKRLFPLIGAVIGVYAVVIAILFVQTGQITVSKKLNYFANPVFATDAAKEKLIRDYGKEKGAELVRKNTHYGTFISMTIQGLYKNLHSTLSSAFPVLLFLFIGAGLLNSELRKSEVIILLVLFIYIFVFPFLKHPNTDRYISCITPFLSVFAGKGIWTLQETLSTKNRHLPKISLIIMLIIFVPWSLKPIFDGKTYRDLLLMKKIGLFIGDRDRKENDKITIIASSPVISFYADARHIHAGSLNESDIIGQLNRIRVDYIVLNDTAWIENLLISSKTKPLDYRVENIKKFKGLNGEQIDVFEFIYKNQKS